MKYKYLPLLALFFCSNVVALTWNSAKIIRTIDTEHGLLADGRVIKILGFDGPDHLFPSLKERGTARKTFQLLTMIFETQTIKIAKDKTDSFGNIFPRYIRLENGTNLTEILLEKGFGKFSPSENTYFDTRFKKAEKSAQKNKRGIWGQSEQEKTRAIKRKIAGVMTQKWKKQYGHLLAPISIGRVKSIQTGNKIILENGACIRLLGVETTSPLDTRKGHQCFGEQSKDFLASLILGKQVELTKDVSQFDDRYCLLRHVWTPKKLNQIKGSIHINKEMIESGFGKVLFPKQDELFNNSFQTAQQNIYTQPKGAWLNCAAQLFQNKTKVLRPFDPECPIKISKSGKIHTPKSSWYTRLSPIQCFKTEEEAHKAGF